jgi:aminopeptidase N
MDRIQLPTNVVPTHYDIFVRPDVDQRTFEGSVKIAIEVMEPTTTVTLNAADLAISRAILVSQGEEVASVVLSDQTAALVFDRTIEPGAYTIALEYTGRIYESAQGLFVSRYDTEQGSKNMLLTQFEAVSARRFLPCWDEPALKATFTISTVVPKDELAISNMPPAEVAALGDGRRYVKFGRSPRMSSYLLFLGIGDFERLEVAAGSTQIAIVARRGSSFKGRFALESAAKLLEYYNDYFGVPYPLPKLDLIAAPGAGGFSAMENWGAILYFETALLLDPDLSPESARQHVFVVVAHEMAHQWFGNLVTMEWWDNLWLNEGFASWMENKATDRFHPDWMMWLQSESARQRAMRQDAQKTTHPVVQEVPSGEQADQAFDDITYRKGQAVIRMLEGYVGADGFRDGVRNYMKRYAYRSTVSDNLWDAIEAASGKTIKRIANDFTLQPGVPLITVEGVAPELSHSRLTLKQGRFAVDESGNEALVWRTPVAAASLGAAGLPSSSVVAGSAPQQLSVEGLPPIKVNFGQTAYYRTCYATDALSGLIDGFKSLPPADQLGLLYDTWALATVGQVDPGAYLRIGQKAPLDTDTIVWLQIVETFSAIDSLYAEIAERDLFRDFANRTLIPLFVQVGWSPQLGQSSNVAVLRENLIVALGQLDEQSVVNEARARFDAFVKDPNSLAAAIREPILHTAARWADASLYDAMYSLAKKANDPFEKDQLFVALASAQAENLAKRSLEVALGDEPTRTTGPIMIARVASHSPALAWQFALANLEKLQQRLDALQRLNFVPSLASQGTTDEQLQALRSYIDEHIPAESRKLVEKFHSDLEFRLKLRRERVPEITKWLQSA